MNVFTIVGSLREKSYNMHLAKAMQQRYSDKISLDIAELKDIPLYNQDDEHNPPEAVKTFKQNIKEADAVIIITPEYNWSIPGVLKNALDWASRVDKVFIDKKVMILGASISTAGTLRAQLQLRQVLSALRANVLPRGANEVTITTAQTKIDEDTGEVTDQNTLEFLDQRIESFIEFVEGK